MLERLSKQNIVHAFGHALQEGLISEVDTSVLFYDLAFLEHRFQHLVNLFPENTLHAVAVKANPLNKILEFLGVHGAGLEVASLPELHIAQRAGYAGDRIVFDSPAKTYEDIKYALEAGIRINADSIEELKRINTIMQTVDSRSTVGVRVNPQVGTGTILTTSVAGDYSKFGVPLGQYRDQLIESFATFNWLTGIHVHIGSQGCELELLVDGVMAVFDLVTEINGIISRQQRRIEVIDIGGGLPVSYGQNNRPTSMERYKAELEAQIPQLFSGQYQIITEFGRYIHANAGWVATRVEYVKRDRDVNTAMIHIGADMFLRECYRPDDWYHEISVLDREGRLKTGTDLNPYILAGPLCFAGDIIANGVKLPRVEEGDYIIVHDAGAYTLSMWSRYNSRQTPKVLGYNNEGNVFQTLKNRESIEDVLDFWR